VAAARREEILLLPECHREQFLLAAAVVPDATPLEKKQQTRE